MFASQHMDPIAMGENDATWPSSCATVWLLAVGHRPPCRRSQPGGTQPGPPSYATDRGLPPAARFANEALLWLVERIFAEEESAVRKTPGSVLNGIPASPWSGIHPEGHNITYANGIYAGCTGRARTAARHDGREYPAYEGFDDFWLIELAP